MIAVHRTLISQSKVVSDRKAEADGDRAAASSVTMARFAKKMDLMLTVTVPSIANKIMMDPFGLFVFVSDSNFD